MKKYLDLFELIAASGIRRVFAVLGAMTVIEAVSFCIFGVARRVYTFENAIVRSAVPIIAALAFAAVFWALTSGSLKRSRPDYLIRRLDISTQGAFITECVFCIMCFAVFLLLQTVLIYVFSLIFTHGPYFSEGPQGIFIDIRQNSFLHQLFPLWNSWITWRNYICVIASGVAAADMSYVRKVERRIPVTPFITMAFALLSFNDILINTIFSFDLFFVLMIVFAALGVVGILDPLDTQE